MSLPLPPWQSPAEQPQLDAFAVHLWRFRLDSRNSLDSLLNDEERKRAARLRDASKARAWIVARGRLRQILSSYVGCLPQEISFAVNAQGKPRLADDAGAAFAFNLSHTDAWGLCAVTAGSEVGVDIEWIDGALDYVRLATRFFSPAENSWIAACGPGRRRREFYRIWTRKEAWLKGKGGGFSEPDLALDPVFLGRNCASDGVWRLRSFPVTRDSLAAVAVQSAVTRIQRWQLF